MVSGVVGIVKVFFHFVSKNFYRACGNDFFIRPNLKKKTIQYWQCMYHIFYYLDI